MKALFARSWKSPLAASIVWRAAVFALVAFTLLALVELWAEQESQRKAVHQAAVHATELALPSIGRAVWAYDDAGLQLLVSSLLHESSIARVQVKTQDGLLQVDQTKADANGALHNAVYELRSPDRREVLGELTVGESFDQVNEQTLRRAAYLLPIELIKVLAIVFGITFLIHLKVVARLKYISDQLLNLGTDASGARIVDRSASKREDEIASLVHTMNAFLREKDAQRAAELARERAEAASRAKTEFLSRVSHELRTPLNAIIGFAQLLELDPTVQKDAQRAARVSQIGRAGRHLTALIGDLLDLSKIDSGAEHMETGPVDVRAAVADVVELVSTDAEQAQVTLLTELDDRASHVKADPMRLRQILLNLLSNAVKYNRPGGRVKLSVAAQGGGQIALRVQDDGLGMNEAQLESLYQPFNRLGRQQSSVKGTGIGLVITKRLTELMGGSLQVISAERQGSTFTLTLPAWEGGHAEASDLSPAQPVRIAAGPGASRWTLVYVEDEPINIDLVRAVLTEHAGFQLEVATTLADGLALITRCQPTLVLLDLHLPDGNGIDLLRILRSAPQTQALRVLVVSADVTQYAKESALAAGADGFVTKPYEFATLMAAIISLLPAP